MTETAASTRVPVSIQLIGGPTVLLEISGLRLLTDPSLDAPGLVPSGDRLGRGVAGDDLPAYRRRRAHHALTQFSKPRSLTVPPP